MKRRRAVCNRHRVTRADVIRDQLLERGCLRTLCNQLAAHHFRDSLYVVLVDMVAPVWNHTSMISLRSKAPS